MRERKPAMPGPRRVPKWLASPFANVTAPNAMSFYVAGVRPSAPVALARVSPPPGWRAQTPFGPDLPPWSRPLPQNHRQLPTEYQTSPIIEVSNPGNEPGPYTSAPTITTIPDRRPQKPKKRTQFSITQYQTRTCTVFLLVPPAPAAGHMTLTLLRQQNRPWSDKEALGV
jgi:hypothetical protein